MVHEGLLAGRAPEISGTLHRHIAVLLAGTATHLALELVGLWEVHPSMLAIPMAAEAHGVWAHSFAF